MTDKDIMAVLADVYNKLYSTYFRGEQVPVVGDCIKMLHSVLQEMNRNAGKHSGGDSDEAV